MEIPAQPERTIIVIPAPASAEDSSGGDRGSEDVTPRDQLKREFRTTSDKPSEPLNSIPRNSQSMDDL